MTLALALARRGLGNVAPNPAVGCVLVKENAVVGRGWTQKGGRPHAETEALRRAGDAARGATAYVTLEPCAHRGETGPCCDALVEAGIARCVVAIEDPDPRVAGRGIARLEKAGIEVAVGTGAAEAEAVNAGFLMRVRAGRPLVTLKLATSLDGRIATHTGESRWITGEHARAWAHLLRAQNDAVLIGSGTVAADDPTLDCRLPGMGSVSPVRVVAAGRLALPLTARLVATAREIPTWIAMLPNAPAERRDALEAAGVEPIEIEPNDDGYLDLGRLLAVLGERGITRVLCEGGSRIAAALLRAGLVDRLVWFRAPRMIGGDGVPAAEAFGVDALAAAPAFRRTAVRPVGDDILETYARA
jgi:diaminohydroxyphosphoribosylaminopyrimidine deaminase / 5-amino-6-(5-phosphoribosylamino)uracil reductase